MPINLLDSYLTSPRWMAVRDTLNRNMPTLDWTVWLRPARMDEAQDGKPAILITRGIKSAEISFPMETTNDLTKPIVVHVREIIRRLDRMDNGALDNSDTDDSRSVQSPQPDPEAFGASAST